MSTAHDPQFVEGMWVAPAIYLPCIPITGPSSLSGSRKGDIVYRGVECCLERVKNGPLSYTEDLPGRFFSLSISSHFGSRCFRGFMRASSPNQSGTLSTSMRGIRCARSQLLLSFRTVLTTGFVALLEGGLRKADNNVTELAWREVR